MKQNITKEQWDSLKNKDIILKWAQKNKYGLSGVFNGFDKPATNLWLPMSIGQMIDFLGDDWQDISGYVMAGCPKIFIEDEPFDVSCVENKELCDVLWEACKYKLQA